jgi:hypothetical protein
MTASGTETTSPGWLAGRMALVTGGIGGSVARQLAARKP